MKGLVPLLGSITISLNCFAQQPTVTQETCDNWIRLQSFGKSCILSNDGKYAVYEYGSRNKSAMVIKEVNGSFSAEYPGGSFPYITPDSKYFIVVLADKRLAIHTLGKKEIEYIADVQIVNVPEKATANWIAYQQGNEKLTVKNLGTGKEMKYEKVTKVVFSENGKALLATVTDGLTWIDLQSGKQYQIPESANATATAFNSEGSAIAFITGKKEENEVRFFQPGMSESSVIANNSSAGIGKGYSINGMMVNFNRNGKKVVFYLGKTKTTQTPGTDVVTNAVNVWTYKDSELQAKQLDGDIFGGSQYSCVADIASSKVFQLENDSLRMEDFIIGNNYAVLASRVSSDEFYWNKQVKTVYLISLDNGKITPIVSGTYPKMGYYATLSPAEKFITWYDLGERKYYCYEIASGNVRVIGSTITTPIYRTLRGEADLIRDRTCYGIAGWLPNDEAVLIYDRTDIWQVDPRDKKNATNATNGLGSKNDITLRLISERGAEVRFDRNKEVLLAAIGNKTKKNGFYKSQLNNADPKLCVLDNYVYYFTPRSPMVSPSSETDPGSFAPVKARSADVYVVRRMNSSDAPELFVTTDFKKYKQISSVHPKKESWVRTELINYELSDGTLASGILHLPLSLEPGKKYPVVFNYYQLRTEGLNVFRIPELAGHNVNIPWYVDRGYLVFEPDMYYKTGKVAQSIIEVVTTAARKLATIPYVDTSRMGAQGQSFGGYETNVIATGTNIFKAASEMAGPTNIISEYGSLRPNGHNNETSADIGQRNLGVYPWEHPEVFIENSPVFQIENATTPLLIVHNKGDGAILYPQAIEMFLGMRRAGKKVWMLEYDGEDHDIRETRNQLDFTIRLQQFFDHYLKGELPPKWMTEGIPAKDKGIVSGLELDETKKP